MAMDTIKLPPGENLAQFKSEAVAADTPGADKNYVSNVNSHGGANAFDQTMLVGSTDVGPRPDNLLRLGHVFFGHDKDELDADAQKHLKSWIKTYQGAPDKAASNPTRVTLEAHASSPGSVAYNTDLANRRAAAVSKFLAENGFTDVVIRVATDNHGEADSVSTAATEDEQRKDRRVDLIVDDGVAQNVVNHEFGHAFGLGDEYATGAGSFIDGTGAAAGTPASHDKQVTDMTDASGHNLPGAIHENNENIMSLGNAVRPQHYATFHTALVDVTGISEWALGAPGLVPTKPVAGGPAPAAGVTPPVPPVPVPVPTP